MLAALLLLLLTPTIRAGAAEPAQAEGSITVTLHAAGEEEPVPGGTLTVYRVGETGEGELRLQDAFADGTVPEAASEGELAEALAAYASQQGISGISGACSTAGTVTFSGLEDGTYLIVQTGTAEGWYPVSPFLVTLPQDGSRAAVAAPKTGKLPEEPEPAGGTMPQTGQLNWPVPVLAAGGLVCIVAGTALGRKHREK